MENAAAAYAFRHGAPSLFKLFENFGQASKVVADPAVSVADKTARIRTLRFAGSAGSVGPARSTPAIPTPTSLPPAPIGPSPPHPEPPADLSFCWNGMLQTMMSQFAVQMVMALLFDGGGADGDDSGLGQCLEELRLFLEGIAAALGQLRTEMHGRFDVVDKKLAAIHADLVYFGSVLGRQLGAMEALAVCIPLRHISCKLDVVTQKLSCLEDMCGDLTHAILWRDVHTAMLDMQLLKARFGPDAVPTKDQLAKWLITLENALMQPSAALKWLSMAYFLGQPHTAAIDAAHFKGVSYFDAIGWVTEGKALIPFPMFVEIVKTYQALRVLAHSGGIIPGYDSACVCARRIVATCQDMSVGAEEVRAKVAQTLAEITRLEAEVGLGRRQCATRDEDIAANWALRRATRVKGLVDAIPDMPLRMTMWLNVHEGVANGHAQQLRADFQREFAEELRACADDYPIIVRPGDPPKMEVAITKKPFLMTGRNKAVIAAALAPCIQADQLDMGSLELHLEIAMTQPYAAGFAIYDGIFGGMYWSENLYRRHDPICSASFGWSVEIHATWTGPHGETTPAAVFSVASSELQLSSLRMHQVRGFWDDPDPAGCYTERITFDGTSTTAFLQGHVFTKDVVGVKSINRTLVHALQQKLDDRARVLARERDEIMKIDMCEARALLRWLVIVGSYPEDLVTALEKHEFGSVRKGLTTAPRPSAAALPLTAPYATFTRDLLLPM